MAEWWLGPTTPNQFGQNPATECGLGYLEKSLFSNFQTFHSSRLLYYVNASSKNQK